MVSVFYVDGRNSARGSARACHEICNTRTFKICQKKKKVKKILAHFTPNNFKKKVKFRVNNSNRSGWVGSLTDLRGIQVDFLCCFGCFHTGMVSLGSFRGAIIPTD